MPSADKACVVKENLATDFLRGSQGGLPAELKRVKGEVDTDVAPGKGWFLSRAGNYLRGAILGHGNVPVIQYLRAMLRDGYQGVRSLEYEGIEDGLMGIQIGHNNLRRMVGMVVG